MTEPDPWNDVLEDWVPAIAHGGKPILLPTEEAWILETGCCDGISKHEGPLGLVVDIGAHVGGFTCWTGVNKAPKGILAVEPFPGNIKKLEESIRRNNVQNVRVIKKAVSWDGILKTTLSQVGNTGQVSQYYHDGNNEAAIECASIREILIGANLFGRELGLATGLTPTPIDFLKCDIEGGEYMFLREDAKDIFAPVKEVFFDLHDISERTYFREPKWLPEPYASNPKTCIQRACVMLESYGFRRKDHHNWAVFWGSRE
jgi:FkbM family methyltransferase